MRMKPDQERVRLLLTDTVTLLCRNGLHFSKRMKVQGLLGITLDDEDVFIVHIDELLSENSQVDNSIGLPGMQSVTLHEQSNSANSEGDSDRCNSPRRKRKLKDKSRECKPESSSTRSCINDTVDEVTELVNIKQEKTDVIFLEDSIEHLDRNSSTALNSFVDFAGEADCGDNLQQWCIDDTTNSKMMEKQEAPFNSASFNFNAVHRKSAPAFQRNLNFLGRNRKFSGFNSTQFPRFRLNSLKKNDQSRNGLEIDCLNMENDFKTTQDNTALAEQSFETYEQCGFSFNSKRKRYECTLEECGRRYLNTFDLYRHQRKKHHVPPEFYQQGRKQTIGVREVFSD